jgi:hypothetical protein
VSKWGRHRDEGADPARRGQSIAQRVFAPVRAARLARLFIKKALVIMRGRLR